jgi:hypothetical protein
MKKLSGYANHHVRNNLFQAFGNFLPVGKLNRAVQGKVCIKQAVDKTNDRAGAGLLYKPLEDKIENVKSPAFMLLIHGFDYTTFRVNVQGSSKNFLEPVQQPFCNSKFWRIFLGVLRAPKKTGLSGTPLSLRPRRFAPWLLRIPSIPCARPASDSRNCREAIS